MASEPNYRQSCQHGYPYHVAETGGNQSFWGRVLVEEFQADVLEWLRQRVEVVVVNTWIEPERWNQEAPRTDAVISRREKSQRDYMKESRGRLKIIARTGVGVDPSRVDLSAARQYKIWVTNMPGSNAVSVAELVFSE